MLDMAAAEKALVAGFHFTFPSMGYAEKEGAKYRLVPIAWSSGDLKRRTAQGHATRGQIGQGHREVALLLRGMAALFAHAARTRR